MGIPAYYSYLIKNHPEILETLSGVDHFYLDGNSIIYDIVYRFPFDMGQIMSDNEKAIILLVIQKIEEYITFIAPQKSVTITFDGVAPFSKLEQQRNRRFKSYYQNIKLKKFIKKYTVADFWDTAKITPGTSFMQTLSIMVNQHFEGRGYNIIASDIPEEGEQKIFEHLRSGSYDNNETHVIYGLDSDLIMLSMLHLDIVPNIFLYRETPEYVKSINPMLDESQNYVLNVRVLSDIIAKEMGETGSEIVDYVFISFLMGNDFMPHFPSLNIRTGGIDKIIFAYRTNLKKIITINRENNDFSISWDNFKSFLSLLAQKEEEYIKTEFILREKREKFKFNENLPDYKMKNFEIIPSISRTIEKHINPTKPGWEERYYTSLFEDCDFRKYIDGLIWNMTYYLFGCPDYHWHYPYNYPPLLKDLIQHIPSDNQHIVWEKKENDITSLEQLCYVLPLGSLHILPDVVREKLKKEWYANDCTFTWSFCKYFWESHADLPEIDFNELRILLNNRLI